MPDAPKPLVTLQLETKRDYVVRRHEFPVHGYSSEWLDMHTKTLVSHATFDSEHDMVTLHYLEPIDGEPQEWLVLAFGDGERVDLALWTYLAHAGPYLIFRQTDQ